MSDTLTAPTASPDMPARPKRFTVITWGCQMNVDDSDQIENLLLEDGLVKTDSIEDADVVMLNSCSVRQKPEDKVFSEVGRIAELKALRLDMVIGVTRCMAQRAGAEIAKRAPHVDVIVGTAQLEKIPEPVRTRKQMLVAGVPSDFSPIHSLIRQTCYTHRQVNRLWCFSDFAAKFTALLSPAERRPHPGLSHHHQYH